MKTSPKRKTRPAKAVRATRPIPADFCPGGASCVETKPKRGGHAFKKRRSFSAS